MIHQRLPAALAAALVAAALCVPAQVVLAGGGGGTYHTPPKVKVYRNDSTVGTVTSRYYIAPGAPMDRTYTWYAPPEGYEVIREGTPSAPIPVTFQGPNGQRRTFPVEGPVVVRTYRYVARNGSR
jgi:hypothetical protein